MALKYSMCLRNKLLGGVPVRHVASYTAATIAAVDGGAGPDSFTDTANGFITAGFSVGDSIMAYGFTGGMAAIHGPFTLVSVAAGTMTVATGLLADDALGESVTLVALVGGSLKDIFKDSVLKLYSGSQPSSPNDAATGTLLAIITVGSGAFVAGAVGNGLELGVPSLGIINKNSDVWSGLGLAKGYAGWGRLYANAADAGGADTTYIYPRIDGAVALSGAEFDMGNTYVEIGATMTVDSFRITQPES